MVYTVQLLFNEVMNILYIYIDTEYFYEIDNNIQNLSTRLLRVKLRARVREISLAGKHFMAVIAKHGDDIN